MKKFSHLVLFCALILFFCSPRTASAHVEEDNMPDSVAEMEYRILLEFEPDNYNIRLKLGMILFRGKKYNEAADEFNYIINNDPDNSEALISLGRVNTQLEKYHSAVESLQKALAIAPDDMHTYYFLGQALELLGNISEAETVYQKGLARKIPPGNKHAEEERHLLVDALQSLRERINKDSEQK